MDAALKDLILQVKTRGTFTGESLESILSKILKKTDVTVVQKRQQIERILGEITQLTAISSLLTSALRDYVNEEKLTEATVEREKEYIELKKKEAEERLKFAIQSEGIAVQSTQHIETPTEKIDIEIPEIKEDKALETDKKKKKIKRI